MLFRSVGAVIVSSYSQGVIAQRNLVLQGPVFCVLHVDVSEQEVGLIHLLSDQLYFWSVDLPMLSSERQGVGMVEIAKHLVVVDDLVGKVGLGHSSSYIDVSGIRVGENPIVLALRVSIPELSRVNAVEVGPLDKPVGG